MVILGGLKRRPELISAAPSGYHSTARLEATPWVLRSELILTGVMGRDGEGGAVRIGGRVRGRAMCRR